MPIPPAPPNLPVSAGRPPPYSGGFGLPAVPMQPLPGSGMGPMGDQVWFGDHDYAPDFGQGGFAEAIPHGLGHMYDL